jgi:hypothetical protein
VIREVELNCILSDRLILCWCFVYVDVMRTELGVDIGTMWPFVLPYHICGLFVLYVLEKSH